MPQIVNTFLKSKMNKDLDSRIIPNGEYRDAQNLQISRSQGAEVGEFENVLGNEQQQYLYTGRNGANYTGKIIGQFTDPVEGNMYIMSAGYSGNGRCPRDIVVYSGASLVSASTISLYSKGPAGTLLNPEVLGVEVGMTLWGDNWNGQPSGDGGQETDAIVTAVTATNIVLSQSITLAGGGFVGEGDKIYIGWNNTIHRYNVNSNTLTLLVRGSFLNFHQDYRIFGINLLEDLLFWTDNRNQPRKINVTLANPLDLIDPTHYVNEDQISVAKYYPYETPLVLRQTIRGITAGTQDTARKGYTLTMADTTNIQIGDIVSGFPSQGSQELWNVIYIDPNVSVVIYNNFKDGSVTQTPGAYNGADNINITFSNTAMSNSAERKLSRGFDQTCRAAGAVAVGNLLSINYNYNNVNTEQSPQPTPRIGDYITSATMDGPSGLGITISDEVVITEVNLITTGATGKIDIKLSKAVTVNAVGNDITISANPNYNDTFTGDPDLIEEKLVRFSYRFKYEDNEYSLAAPYTQICFIPDQEGIVGGGKNEQLQDMLNIYDSTIVEWFKNKIDTIALKIPLPDGGGTRAEALQSLIDNYKITNIEILYKESDGLSSKILDSIEVNNLTASNIVKIPNDINNSTQWYYDFNYESIKPYRTLPTSEQNRVYDNVPLKALGQEISANRVIYGNFLQKHTPPNNLDYEVINSNKSVSYDNYSQYPNHSIKQNRNYQVGWVLSDRYGRASSVILSSNDDNPLLNGSTIYVPYKTFGEVDDPINDVTTYKWLGNALRVKLNNGINQTTNNSITGEPGLFKAESDTGVDEVNLVSGGVGHAVGDIITFSYLPTVVGLGQDLSIEVVSETGGVITGLKIVNRGSGYVNGQQLHQSGTTGTGTSAVINIVVYDANPTGWQSYKLVVKQQEQEYYNVYLPGFISGYPVINSSDYGRVAFSVLLGDNINKVPRDLNEVGPLQDEFSASVNLFGRVNNPNIDNKNKGSSGNYYNNRIYPWNTQYFPGRQNDEAVTIGTIGASGLQLGTSPFTASVAAGDFDNATGSVPWGTTGLYQSLYNQEQAPIAMGLKIGAEESQPQLTQSGSPQLNTLGSKVTANVFGSGQGTNDGCMVPFLSVSETSPVESLLEIFYESSTSGNFIDLNRQVNADYAGVSGTTATAGSFDESDTSGTDVITAFSFTDSAGNNLTLDSVPTITQVLDGNGVDVTGAFTIVQNGGTPLNFDIKTNQLFWYGKETPSKSNTFSLSFQTSYSSGAYIDILNNQITINLNNVAPEIGGFTPSVGPDAGSEQACGKAGGSSGYDSTVTNFGQFTGGKNGSADPGNNTLELCYSLSVLAAPVGSTAVFEIDQTGNVTKTSGTSVNGTYSFECTLTDAASSCVSSTGSLQTTCNYDVVLGTPKVNQVLCFGAHPATMSGLDTTCVYGGTGYPLEVFFGANRFVNSGINGTVGLNVGSSTSSLLGTIDTSLGLGATGYQLPSNGGLDLRYYNAYQEALNNFTCGLPPVTPAFTTGKLVQGVFALKVILSKTAFASTSNDYKTNFTILYRASASDPWQLATTDSSSPTDPSSTVGNFNQLDVTGSGIASASLTYHFSAVGEYAFRNTGVQNGTGCTGGGCYTCARVDVEFYDATFGVASPACVDCTGPL